MIRTRLSWKFVNARSKKTWRVPLLSSVLPNQTMSYQFGAWSDYILQVWWQKNASYKVCVCKVSWQFLPALEHSLLQCSRLSGIFQHFNVDAPLHKSQFMSTTREWKFKRDESEYKLIKFMHSGRAVPTCQFWRWDQVLWLRVLKYEVALVCTFLIPKKTPHQS